MEIKNLTRINIKNENLENLVNLLFKETKANFFSSFSISFVGPRRIKKLNKAYFKKNRVVPFLIFPQKKIIWQNGKAPILEEIKEGGEIVFCLKEIKKMARRKKEDFQKMLLKTIIEAILLFLGKKEKFEFFCEKFSNITLI